MATVYTIGLVIYVATVTFWMIRLLMCLIIKDPKSKITMSLQKSFFSMCFATGKEMAYTTLVYVSTAFIGYLFGFTLTAHGMLVYLSLLTIQWLYVNTEENRRRYNEILLADELVLSPA